MSIEIFSPFSLLLLCLVVLIVLGAIPLGVFRKKRMVLEAERKIINNDVRSAGQKKVSRILLYSLVSVAAFFLYLGIWVFLAIAKKEMAFSMDCILPLIVLFVIVLVLGGAYTRETMK